MAEEITAEAPATVANVGAGFDTFGFALNFPFDRVTVRRREKPGVVMAGVTSPYGEIPTDPKKNTAGVAVLGLLNHLGIDEGIEVSLEKKIPLRSGLGSSAASAAAAVVAANALLGNPLKRHELVQFVVEAERVACGAGHADNAAPAVLGNFTIVRSNQPLDIIPIAPPKELVSVVVHPEVELDTGYSRTLLPKQISLNDAIQQWSNAASLVAGLLTNNFEVLGRAVCDVVAEPKRSKLIPNYQKAKEAALDNGALCFNISGGGPSVFAFTTDARQAKKIGEAVKHEFQNVNVDAQIYISPINPQGSRIPTHDQ